MSLHYPCCASDHLVARRSFLGTMAATGTGAIVGGGWGHSHSRLLPISSDVIRNES